MKNDVKKQILKFSLVYESLKITINAFEAIRYKDKGLSKNK